MIQAIGYIRSATRNASALKRQRNAIRAHCRLNGWSLVHIYADDGVSGITLNRPGLDTALSGLRAGSVLVITASGRLFRRVDAFAALKTRIAVTGARLSCA